MNVKRGTMLRAAMMGMLTATMAGENHWQPPPNDAIEPTDTPEYHAERIAKAQAKRERKARKTTSPST